ncbi:hypothetical protein KSP39_PZI002206 [Platanthera zijinensis]|uniref:Uncharacterized protein n=1 Tax=Platanthera zijinensis TaxID=2320716 RepID=A0AAP0BZ91_9ASPA
MARDLNEKPSSYCSNGGDLSLLVELSQLIFWRIDKVQVTQNMVQRMAYSNQSEVEWKGILGNGCLSDAIITEALGDPTLPTESKFPASKKGAENLWGCPTRLDVCLVRTDIQLRTISSRKN